MKHIRARLLTLACASVCMGAALAQSSTDAGASVGPTGQNGAGQPAAAPAQQAPQAPTGQMQAPGTIVVDRARLETRLAAVQLLIERSTAANQIEKSGDVRALEQRAKAREVHRQASEAFKAGELEKASRLLPQASALMFEAVRMAAPEQVTGDKLRIDFDSRMESVRSLLAAQKRIAAEKPGLAGAREASASIERLMTEARDLASADRLVEARTRLDQAYYVAKAAIGSMRGGDTLVRSLNFATKEEEFKYELDRNDTHKMLIQVLLADRRANPNIENMVRNFMEKAARLREQADGAARQGDFPAAIKLLEDSTGELVRAIRGAGVFIPG